MQPNEIHALIQLLDDPDEGVYLHVREQLLAKGTSVLPALLESREAHAQCEEHERRMDELVEGLHGAFDGQCGPCSGERSTPPAAAAIAGGRDPAAVYINEFDGRV